MSHVIDDRGIKYKLDEKKTKTNARLFYFLAEKKIY